jgi:hypothetical protein
MWFEITNSVAPEPEDSAPYSQKLVNGPYTEPTESSQPHSQSP